MRNLVNILSKEEQPKSQYWINIRLKTTTPEGEVKYVSLPLGIALDKQSGNLARALCQKGSEMNPGEEVKLGSNFELFLKRAASEEENEQTVNKLLSQMF